ncbi:MAG: hypothetical protein ACK5HZ_12045 [Macellibacteroides fermentans]|uniref:hypothetical protein n=1 Tax=Macellibacteroides fermentans TaxID=879969 RepID=UPI003AD069BF
MLKSLELNYLDSLLESGYVRVPRKVLNDLYGSDAEEQLIAHVYLFLFSRSYFATGTVIRDNKQLTCHRGQVICSQAELAAKFNLSPWRVRGVLNILKERYLIEVENIKGISHIGMLYYDSIAGKPKQESSSEGGSGKKRHKERETEASNTTFSLKGHILDFMSND